MYDIQKMTMALAKIGVTFEKNIFYEAAALALLFCGPGAYSIDAMIARNSREAVLMPRR